MFSNFSHVYALHPENIQYLIDAGRVPRKKRTGDRLERGSSQGRKTAETVLVPKDIAYNTRCIKGGGTEGRKK